MAVFALPTIERLADWLETHLLDESGDILENHPIRSASGGNVPNWVHIATVKCAVLDAGAPQEQVQMAQTVGSITKLLLFKRGTTILGTHRVKIGALTYQIIDVFEPNTVSVLPHALARRTSLPT
jgi:hypothetical protein